MSSVDVRNLAQNAGAAAAAPGGDPLARADADMKHVLDVLAGLGPKPIEQCSAPEARAQPGLAQALARLLRTGPDDQGVAMEFRMIPGPAGDIRARVYTPRRDGGNGGAAPLLLYLHGGGWVIGDLDSYDATPRALARRCGAVVVSAHYRQAPEHRFPAAHLDSYAAWQWLLANAEALGGAAAKAAVVGEGSGANMAVNIALRARHEGAPVPLHLGLVTPMAGGDPSLPSYAENAEARPLNTATVRWFLRKALRDREAAADPRLRLAERADLGGLPPTTIVLAEIDPLRSEGEALADALRRSGVWVDCTTYDGVTHQFFGLAQVVNKAMFAQAQMARNLLEAFGR
ncbi:alpha/beta hydrolase [Devosia sp.]|uniref:alpha/beta hydrolase n=1 Tax=Devosia sp. TaxID=1871048 RepID=UPI002F088D72